MPARRPAVSPSARHTTRSSRRATTSAAIRSSPGSRSSPSPMAAGMPGHLDRHAHHLGHLAVALGRARGQRRLGERVKQRGHRLLPVQPGPRRTCRTRSRADPSCPSRMALPTSATAPPRSTEGSATTVRTRPRSSASSVSTSSGIQPDGGRLQALIERQHPGDGVAARGGGQHQFPTQERLEEGEGQLGGGRFDLGPHAAFALLGCRQGSRERRERPGHPLRLFLLHARGHGSGAGQTLGVPLVVPPADGRGGFRLHRLEVDVPAQVGRRYDG